MKFLFLTANLFITIALFSQNPYSAIIKKQANDVALATKNNDYQTVQKHTYPKLVSMLGGKEKMEATSKKMISKMQSQGFKIESVIIGEPEKIYNAGTELHCLVPQTIIFGSVRGRLQQSSYLLAVSTNKGAYWYFMDAAKLDAQNAGTIFPKFNTSLVLPQKQAPKYLPN